MKSPNATATINVVSRMPEEMLRRQEPTSTFEYTYSTSPVKADWHVVIDMTEALVLPNVRSRCIFVVAEPPEIRKYDRAALLNYGVVLSAPFGYLRGLGHIEIASGLLPWRVGVGIESGPPRINLSRQDLKELQPSKRDLISVVTSQKTYTKQQVQRLKLIEYLASRIPEMEVFGRDNECIDDKADALIPSRYHLALENCSQSRFWTEKLSDSILTQNITFYSGRNHWEVDFPGNGAIVEIDLSTPKRTYEIIRRVLDADPDDAVQEQLTKNKALVMNVLNLHTAIERAIPQASLRTLSSEAATTIIPHHRTRKDIFVEPMLSHFRP